MRGGERQLAFLHQGLLDQGWSSTILCREPSVFGALQNVIALPWAGVMDLPGLLRFWKKCRQLQPEVLHAHDANAFTLAMFLGALNRLPVVMTRRVLFPIRMHLLNRWKYAHVAQLVAVSNAVEQSLRVAAPTTPIRVVSDAVEGAPISAEQRLEARKRLGLQEDVVVIGSVGHFTEEKNASLLLDTAEHLAQTRKNAFVVCVGPLDEKAGKRARRLSNVLATGFVADPLELYAAFDLYASTSLLEGLGSALLDAVVRDIPAIAVDAGGVRDIFGDLPRLASPGDRYDFIRLLEQSLDALESMREESHTLGAVARQRFTLAAMIEGNMDVYRQLPLREKS